MDSADYVYSFHPYVLTDRAEALCADDGLEILDVLNALDLPHECRQRPDRTMHYVEVSGHVVEVQTARPEILSVLKLPSRIKLARPEIKYVPDA